MSEIVLWLLTSIQSVTQILFKSAIPSFRTTVHNIKVIVIRLSWCNSRNTIVKHLHSILCRSSSSSSSSSSTCI